MKEAKKHASVWNNWLAISSVVVLGIATLFIATQLYLRYERGRLMFVCEKTDKEAQDYLQKIVAIFNKSPNAEDFVNKVNQRHVNLMHATFYPWVFDYQRRIVAHGQHAIAPIADERSENFSSNRITIATINNAKTFPVAFFYTVGNKVKRAIVDKVEKDRQAFFLGVSYTCG